MMSRAAKTTERRSSEASQLERDRSTDARMTRRSSLAAVDLPPTPSPDDTANFITCTAPSDLHSGRGRALVRYYKANISQHALNSCSEHTVTKPCSPDPKGLKKLVSLPSLALLRKHCIYLLSSVPVAPPVGTYDPTNTSQLGFSFDRSDRFRHSSPTPTGKWLQYMRYSRNIHTQLLCAQAQPMRRRTTKHLWETIPST